MLSGLLPGSTRLTAAILLSSRDPAGLQAAIEAVNDPSSDRYHHYLSPDGFRGAFRPGPGRRERSDRLAAIAGPGAPRLERRASARRRRHAARFDAAFGTEIRLAAPAGPGPLGARGKRGRRPRLLAGSRAVDACALRRSGADDRGAFRHFTGDRDALAGPAAARRMPRRVRPAATIRHRSPTPTISVPSTAPATTASTRARHWSSSRRTTRWISPPTPSGPGSSRCCTTSPSTAGMPRRGSIRKRRWTSSCSARWPRAPLSTCTTRRTRTYRCQPAGRLQPAGLDRRAGAGHVLDRVRSHGGAHTGPGDGRARAFRSAQLQGTTIVAATGDTGAYACATTSSAGAPSVNLPASDPYVLAVAATELYLGPTVAGGARTAMRRPGPATALCPGATIAVRRVGPRAVAPARCSTPATPTETICPGRAPCPTERPGSSAGLPDVSISGSGSNPLYEYAYLRARAVDLWRRHQRLGARVGGPDPADRPVPRSAQPAQRRLDRSRRSTSSAARLQMLPAYHDVMEGNNLLYPATVGWDYATGWGSPYAWNFTLDMACSAGVCPRGPNRATATATARATTAPMQRYLLGRRRLPGLRQRRT